MDYQRLRLLIPRYSQQWTKQDVCQWLKFINLQALVSQFDNKSVDGSCLRLLDQKDLTQQLNIKSKITCKKILNWIRVGLLQFDQYLTIHLQNSQNDAQFLQMEPFQKTQVHEYNLQSSQLDLRRSVKKKEQWNMLFLKKVDGKQNIYHKFKQGDCRIGADPNCQIVVTGDGVDHFHTLISFRKQQYYLRNLSTEFVTFAKVNSRVPVYHGMQVQMGSNVFRFNLDANIKLQVKIVQGKKSDYTFKFESKETKLMIGRKSTNDISFSDDNTLSNLHARLTFVDGCWYIEDLATTNGTWIELDKQYKIYTGLIFKLGMTNHQFQCELRRVKQTYNEQINIINTAIQSQYCNICHKNIKNILFQPCNHCQVCETCTKSLISCILCHQKIINFIKIYKS